MLRKLPYSVLREILPWYLGGVALFFSLLMTDALSNTAAQLQAYQPGVLAALTVFSYKVPLILGKTLAAAVPFAVLLGFGRLAKDSELKAAQAAGVRPLSLLWPLLLPGLLIGGFSYYNTGWLTPAGESAWWNGWYTIYKRPPPPPSTPRYAYAQGDTLFTAGLVENSTGNQEAQLWGVVVVQGDTTYSAGTGTWNVGKRSWTLQDGYVVGPDGVPRPRRGPLVLAQRDSLKVSLDRPEQTATTALAQRASQAQVRRGLAPAGTDELTDRYELARRVADPFTPLVFALAAGALGLLVRNRAWGAASVILFLFSFYVLYTTAPQLARSGALPPTAAAWLPNLLFALLGLGLAWRLR